MYGNARRQYKSTVKLDGGNTFTQDMTVSADGKTRTMITKGKNAQGQKMEQYDRLRPPVERAGRETKQRTCTYRLGCTVSSADGSVKRKVEPLPGPADFTERRPPCLELLMLTDEGPR
jgi:hypothetical protein